MPALDLKGANGSRPPGWVRRQPKPILGQQNLCKVFTFRRRSGTPSGPSWVFLLQTSTTVDNGQPIWVYGGCSLLSTKRYTEMIKEFFCMSVCTKPFNLEKYKPAKILVRRYTMFIKLQIWKTFDSTTRVRRFTSL